MRIVAIILVAVCIGCDRSSQASGTAQALPTTVEGSGVIRGQVRFVGTAPAMKTFIANEPCCSGEPAITEETVIVNSNRTLQNVMVYLEGAPKLDGSAQPQAVLDQVRCRYVPHVLGVQVGQALRVRSSDPTMHNVHYVPDKNRARNLSMTQAGAEIPVKFDHPEIIRMKCDVHPWMTAWVGVFENSFFDVSGNDGTFEITGVPAGTYKLVAWHELYGKQEASVSISNDEPVESEFVFGIRPRT